MSLRLLPLAFAAILAAPLTVFAADDGRLAMPDFTNGDAIPAKAKHDWNLGATGLRGSMFCDKMDTTDARQIAVTKVTKGSPADGVVAVGDVILGVGCAPIAKKFTFSARPRAASIFPRQTTPTG